jgi:hypothetical protein
MNVEHSSEYDTSGMYLGAQPAATEARAPERPEEAEALDDPALSVARTVQPAASAVLMYSEYLLAAAKTLPPDQREILDRLRRQAHVVMWGLALAVADAERKRDTGGRRERAIA